MRGPIEQRFWRFVSPEPNTGCWLWDGSWWKGYGTISNRLATHVSLELHGRPRPVGMQACHHCDVPACVNPEHLYWGDDKQNRADMFRRGRQNLPFGSAHVNSKLDESLIRAIRASDRRHRELAAEYGVCRQLIGEIKAGRRWAWVT